jgi:hypothetical protein
MSFSRLTICACTETSSADTGSSHTIETRVERQRAGDADALALSAGEFMRIATGMRRRKADHVEQLGDAPLDAGTGRQVVNAQEARPARQPPSCAD